MFSLRKALISTVAAAAILAATGLPSRSDNQKLVWIPDSTQRIAQLTGDYDRAFNKPTISQIGKKYGADNTDLGSSFEHNGKLYFLFGDTWGRPGSRDFIAWTTRRDPADIDLHLYVAPDGKWLPLTVPGIAQGGFDVPSGGVSVNGKIYVVFTTDYPNKEGLMARSVLAVSADNGKTFRQVYSLSTAKFINVSFWQADGWLYIFASGPYRKSSPYLARVRPTQIEDKAALQYFTGLDSHSHPEWGTTEDSAAPLFVHNVLGEFSVAYVKQVGRYVMLYNSTDPRGIIMRSASKPWGPWSDATMIFEPWRDNGYGHFMHIPPKFNKGVDDHLSDPGREDTWGGEYGPYIISRYTKGKKGECRLYFTMSTWNPYQVMVMTTQLKLEREMKAAQ